MYTDAGARRGDAGDEGDAQGAQKRAGGAHDMEGRPVGTRRFTHETRQTGCRKAMGSALLQYGAEPFFRRLKTRITCKLSEKELSDRLAALYGVSYRG